MKSNKLIKILSKYKYCIGIAVVSIVFFVIIYPTGLVFHDDLHTYYLVRSNQVIQDNIMLAKSQSRIQFLFTGLLTAIPFIIDNYFSYKIISYACALFNCWAIFRLASRHINREIAYLSVLFFLTFAQINSQHNPFIGYIIPHQIAIGILLLSLECFLSFYDVPRLRTILLSAFLFFFSIVIYEVFILFSLLFFVIAFYKNRNAGPFREKLSCTMYDLRFHIILSLLFLGAYFLWRRQYPSSYDGASFDFSNMMASVKSIIVYACGQLPMSTALRVIRSPSFIPKLKPEYLLKAIVASIITVKLAKEEKQIKDKWLFVSVFALGIFLPTVLISFTPKYLEWLEFDTYAYIPSFYSYVFFVLLFCLLACIIYKAVRWKKAIMIIAVVGVFACSVLTDMSNAYYTGEFAKTARRQEMFDNVVSNREIFAAVEENAIIWAPDYYGIHNNLQSLGEIIKIHNSEKNNVDVVKDLSQLKNGRPSYFMRYLPDNNIILFGEMDEDYRTRKVAVFTSKSFVDNLALLIEEFEEDGSSARRIQPVPSGETLMWLETGQKSVNAINLDVISVDENGALAITFSAGFHPAEQWGQDIARWCRAEGEVAIYNPRDESIMVTLDAQYGTLSPKGGALRLNGERVAHIDSEQTQEPVLVQLEPGINILAFSCDAEPTISAEGRELVFYILNPEIKLTDPENIPEGLRPVSLLS